MFYRLKSGFKIKNIFIDNYSKPNDKNFIIYSFNIELEYPKEFKINKIDGELMTIVKLNSLGRYDVISANKKDFFDKIFNLIVCEKDLILFLEGEQIYTKPESLKLFNQNPKNKNTINFVKGIRLVNSQSKNQ